MQGQVFFANFFLSGVDAASRLVAVEEALELSLLLRFLVMWMSEVMSVDSLLTGPGFPRVAAGELEQPLVFFSLDLGGIREYGNSYLDR